MTFADDYAQRLRDLGLPDELIERAVTSSTYDAEIVAAIIERSSAQTSDRLRAAGFSEATIEKIRTSPEERRKFVETYWHHAVVLKVSWNEGEWGEAEAVFRYGVLKTIEMAPGYVKALWLHPPSDGGDGWFGVITFDSFHTARDAIDAVKSTFADGGPFDIEMDVKVVYRDTSDVGND